MLDRCTLVEFTHTFKEANVQIDQCLWAQSLNYMAMNFEKMPPPIVEVPKEPD